jgi:hypothetical protein
LVAILIAVIGIASLGCDEGGEATTDADAGLDAADGTTDDSGDERSEAIWDPVEDRCPPTDLTPTPFAPIRDSEPNVGEAGVLWEKPAGCGDWSDADGNAGHDMLYGVIDWEGEPREVIINVNQESAAQWTSPRSLTILDATNGDELACLELGRMSPSSTPVLVQQTGTLYFSWRSAVSEENMDVPGRHSTGVVAFSLASQDASPNADVLFRHSWSFEGSATSPRFRTRLTVMEDGVLGVSNASSFAAMNAQTGEFYWDARIPADAGVSTSPKDALIALQPVFQEGTTVRRHDRCGNEKESEKLDWGEMPIPVGDDWVRTEDPHVVVLDTNWQQFMRTKCESPVVVDDTTIACVNNGTSDWIKWLELDSEESDRSELPGRTEGRDELRFSTDLIALDGRRVLLHADVGGATETNASRLYVHDLESGRQVEVARVEAGLRLPLRMSHRGVIYARTRAENEIVAIQTDERPAPTGWAFGESGNDNRGWRVAGGE